MNIDHFNNIKNIIQESEKSGVLFFPKGLTGYSGEKLIGTLQRLAKYQETIGGGCYLEIGVFQGLTLLSVASVLSKDKAHGVDNFSQFDPEKKNQDIIFERAEANDLKNFKMINADYEDALENLNDHIGDQKIGTYFIDGPHDYRSQLICLLLAKPHLSDRAVIIVDDCNYRHVRQANRDFLVSNPDFKLIYQAYTSSHPNNMDKETEKEARKGWWNGVNIMVYDPKGELESMMPDTIRNRILYENEHLTQSTQLAFLAPQAMYIVQLLLASKNEEAKKRLLLLPDLIKHTDKSLIGEYFSLNTFSKDLTKGEFNQTILS